LKIKKIRRVSGVWTEIVLEGERGEEFAIALPAGSDDEECLKDTLKGLFKLKKKPELKDLEELE